MRIKGAKVSDPNSFVSCPGSDDHILYEGKLNSAGQVVLMKCGVESISQKINAQKEFTDIAYIRSRLACGDTSVLRDGAVYADLTSMPKTMSECLQLGIDAKKKFYDLPLDIRSQFNNNYNEWLLKAGSDEWFRKMNINVDPVSTESEVKEDDA